MKKNEIIFIAILIIAIISIIFVFTINNKKDTGSNIDVQNIQQNVEASEENTIQKNTNNSKEENKEKSTTNKGKTEKNIKEKAKNLGEDGTISNRKQRKN